MLPVVEDGGAGLVAVGEGVSVEISVSRVAAIDSATALWQ